MASLPASDDSTTMNLLSPPSLSRVHFNAPPIGANDLLGSGGFGAVYLETRNGRSVAVKRLLYVRHLTHLRREVKNLQKLSHPNIVRYIEFYTSDGGQTSNIVTEYCPRGDLRKFINDKDQRYSISLVIDWACQIFDTLVYLEKERIYHRDIKPANILLGEKCEIKLCDFGLSKSEITENSGYNVSGTMRYMPPETFDTINGERIYTYASDLYSVGIVLWECIERRAVFGNISKSAILFARMFHGVPLERAACRNCVADLIDKCVRRVPENRPAAAKALDEASGLKNEPFYAEFCTRLYWLEPDSKNTLPRPVDGKCEPEPTIEAQLEASAELVEIVDKMREGKEVTVEEKWVKKAIERKMIPAEFTSEDGFQLDITIDPGEWKIKHQFVEGKTDLHEVYCSFVEALGNCRKDDPYLRLSFSAAISCDISRMMNILHSPIFRGVLSRTRGWLSLQNSQEYPSEMAVYECAGVWKELLLWGNDSGEDGINCSSFAIRNIQKLLNGGTSEGRGFDIHRGPWHFPFIGEKQKAFEEKYNVRIALITHERDESTDRLLSIFPCNKPETLLSLGDGSERYFEISMASPFDIGKYEQMELGIMAKDETMKVTSEKINEWTYKRTMEPEEEGEEPWIWTANYRPTFDDINCFHCLKGPLPDMSYCSEFHEMC